MSENKGNKLVVDDIEVIVRGIANKPYYEIKYREVGNDDYNIGFGSYDLNNVLKWKEEEFEVVSEKEEKETKEVTNRMLLEHLKEIEIAHGCLANGINTLFSVMSERNEQLKLSRVEEEIIKHGQIALGCLTERMIDISGMMNEELNRRKKERQAFEEEYEIDEDDYENMKGFVDFLKEIFE